MSRTLEWVPFILAAIAGAEPVWNVRDASAGAGDAASSISDAIVS